MGCRAGGCQIACNIGHLHVQIFRSLLSMPVSHPISDLVLYRIAVLTDNSRTDCST